MCWYILLNRLFGWHYIAIQPFPASRPFDWETHRVRHQAGRYWVELFGGSQYELLPGGRCLGMYASTYKPLTWGMEDETWMNM